MNKIVLLLTGCINPGEMPFTHLTNKDERMRQYKNAIDFYLHKTDYPIVFAENSNTDISNDYKKDISRERLEIITFKGNDNKQRGKGYGEAIIIEYALKHSQLIKNDSYIVKITGRLIVENIQNVIHKNIPFQPSRSICCSFHSDLHFSDSRIFGAPKDFLVKLVDQKNRINDNLNIYFEHILANCAINAKEPCYPFWEEPCIIGMSGSTGNVYLRTDTSKLHELLYKNYILKQVITLSKNKKIYTSYHIILYHIIIGIIKIEIFIINLSNKFSNANEPKREH